MKKLKLTLSFWKGVLHGFYKWLFLTQKKWWPREKFLGAFNRYRGLENDTDIHLIKNHFLFSFFFLVFVIYEEAPLSEV